MVQAAAQAQAVVAAAKSRGDGLVPMNASQINALSQIQAQAIVHARKSPGTPSQIQTQIHLQAQALVHAHTQAQIQAGIFKGDSSTSNNAADAPKKKASPAMTPSQMTEMDQLKQKQRQETQNLIASNPPPEQRQALDQSHQKQRKDLQVSFRSGASATAKPAPRPVPAAVRVPNPVAAVTASAAQPMQISAPASAPLPATTVAHPPAPVASHPSPAAAAAPLAANHSAYAPPPPVAATTAAYPPGAPGAPQGPPPSSNSPAFLAQLNSSLGSFWNDEQRAIEALENQSEQDFKNHNDLPLARIKRIMKSDEDVRMISAEAPVLFAKACELFILDLSIRSWNYSQLHKRRTLQKEDIREAMQKTDIFDFLVDVIH